MKKKIIRGIAIAMFLFVSVIVTKLFIVDIYYVPSASMENSIPAKSHVLLKKYIYGASLPHNTYEIPYLSSVFKLFEPIPLWKHKRLPAFRVVNRNDIVLATRDKLKVVKRVVGLPGDTVKVREGLVWINSVREPYSPWMQFTYLLQRSDVNTTAVCQKIKTYKIDGDFIEVVISGDEMCRLELCDTGQLLMPKFYPVNRTHEDGIYPKCKRGAWSRSYFGEFVLPFKGMEITLNKETLCLYREIIETHEGSKIIQAGCCFLVNNKRQSTFRFNNGYYFLMGDNRMESMDSRFLGPFPDYTLQGQVVSF